MGKVILKIIFILIIGALGGVIFQAFILPYLATKETFKNFGFVKILTEREVNLHPTNEIIIQENTALQDAVEKINKVVVGIRAQSIQGKIIEGSGLILTTDGYLVAPGNIFPKGYNFNLFWEGEKLSPQILKVGLKENLLLVKIEKSNLPTVAFADFGSIRLGQRVFLMGVVFEDGVPKKTVNEGIIKSVSKELVGTNIIEQSNLQGSPLFNIKGEVVGLVEIDQTGQVSAIPVNKIREFTGF